MQQTKTHPLSDTVEAKLLRLGHAHRRLVENRLQDTDIHRGQPPLLFALSRQDGLSIAELAEQLYVTPPTISNMVKRMQQSGFVAKRRDSDDERVTRVYLTEQGRAAMDTLRDAIGDVNATIRQGLSAEEIAFLTAILDKLIVNLETALENDA